MAQLEEYSEVWWSKMKTKRKGFAYILLFRPHPFVLSSFWDRIADDATQHQPYRLLPQSTRRRNIIMTGTRDDK